MTQPRVMVLLVLLVSLCLLGMAAIPFIFPPQ
jgi:hypothetical protein